LATGNQDRLNSMRRAMAKARLDALVLRLPENVLLLSGYWPMTGTATLLFPREGRATLVMPDSFSSEAESSVWEAATVFFGYGVLGAGDPAVLTQNALRDAAAGKGWKRVGYEANFQQIAPSWHSGEAHVPVESTRDYWAATFPGSELVDASAMIQQERAVKTAYEAAKMRIAAEISCIGMQAFRNAVSPGISGVELVAIVEAAIMSKGAGYKGATRVRAYAGVATGADEGAIAYRMHEISTRRPMGNGEVALLELGVVADGYWADRTRAWVAGKPTELQLRVADVVKRAQEASCSAMRPSVRGAEVDEAGRSVIRDAGMEKWFPHITGHGLGFGYHESLVRLAPGSKDVLAAGMLSSVEPGLYASEFGGIRIEDDVLVTETGHEALGPFPKEITN
jgi:Xaa-Pro dipeptidase